MNGSFSITELNNIRMVTFRPWIECSFQHGFLLKGPDFSDELKQDTLLGVSEAVGLERIVVSKQVHGRTVADISEAGRLESDAIVSAIGEQAIGIGIFTADCLPILVRSPNHVTAIHAGWRGLANGVIAQAFKILKQRGETGAFEAIIGPCAGSSKYEVGPEVISAIKNPVYKASGAKFLLDLAATAVEQIRACGASETTVHNCEICTISDLRFNSYRRDGAPVGRNLSFVAAVREKL